LIFNDGSGSGIVHVSTSSTHWGTNLLHMFGGIRDLAVAGGW
jgi:hypothetical protein